MATVGTTKCCLVEILWPQTYHNSRLGTSKPFPHLTCQPHTHTTLLALHAILTPLARKKLSSILPLTLHLKLYIQSTIIIIPW